MLALATVRHRWPSLVGTFAALALGVALLTATLSVFAAAQPAAPDRFAGTPVIVQSPAAGGDNPFTRYVPWSAERTATLVEELSAIPGVTAAVADRSFYAQVVLDGVALDAPRAADPLGRAWSVAALAPYPLTAGAPPVRDGEVVLDAGYGIGPGEPVRLLTATGPAEYTVTGTVAGPGIYLSDAAVASMGPGVTAIGLLTTADAGTAAVAAAAQRVVGERGQVLTGDAREALEPLSHARTRWIGAQLLVAMAMLAAFATIFVVASTYALATHQRRQELALLRAVGATPGQVRRLMLGESLLVGLFAAVAGAALGAALTPVLGDLLVRAELEPPGFAASPGVTPVVAAAGTGLVVCLLGVWLASRRGARVRPLEALRDATVDRRPMTRTRWVGGILFAAGGLALAAATPAVEPEAAITTAMGSALALIAGLALLTPAFAPAVARLVAYPLDRLAGATGLLVRENAATAARRTAATTAPVLLTVGFAVLVLGMVATMAPAFGSEAGRQVGAEVVVRPDGTPGLSDAAVAAAAETLEPDGFLASALRSTAYVTGADGSLATVAVGGVDAVTLSAVGHTFQLQAGSLDGLTAPDAVAVTAGAASAYGWRVGGDAELTLADGELATMRVIAVVADQSVPAPVLLARDVVRAHDASALSDLGYAGGTTPSDLVRLDRALAGLGATAATAAEYEASDDEDRLVWIFAWIIVGLSIGYTSLAVANTLVMATGDRRRDFAVLRLSGATAGQVLRMVGAETLLVVGLGSAMGFAVALPALLGMRSALAESTGQPVELLLPWAGLAGVVAACVALALTASLVSTRLATRTSPAR